MRVVILAPFGDEVTEHEVTAVQRYNDAGEFDDAGAYRQFEIGGVFYAEHHVREVP